MRKILNIFSDYLRFRVAWWIFPDDARFMMKEQQAFMHCMINKLGMDVIHRIYIEDKKVIVDNDDIYVH